MFRILQMARSVESMVKTETLSRELLGNVGKLPITSIDRGAGAEAGVGVPGVDPHPEATGLPPQVLKTVVGVVKDTHQENAQPITKFAKGAKSKATSNNIVKQETQGVPTNLEGLEGNNLRYPRGLNNHLAMDQGLTMNSVRIQYTLHSTKDPKHPSPTIFYLMKYQIPKY